ncbi:hypothetical protein AMS68_001256 [Peltaster fructicola]|uniref:DUF4211 domain-containing protein n=1 Tax=Peltaster fructicola TaxID=286661 RepID=A0A6H0XM85_9PEZI|nr:hypothetical protein AMS68_001256 [Peltaster fructicola]
MAGSKKAHSQQTRIAFTPLPSSSPAAKEYHQQIKDRAAAVRYETASPSPAKRRRIQDDSRDHETAFPSAYLPTPDTPLPTSSLQSVRRSRKRARQQRLDFPVPSRSESTQPQIASTQNDGANDMVHGDDSDEMPVKSAKKRRTGNGLFMSSAASMRTRRQSRLESEPSGSNTRKASTAPTNLPDHNSDDSGSDDDEDDMPTTIGIRKRGSQRSSQPQRTSSPPFEEPSDDDLEIIQVRTSKAQEHRSDATSEDDVLPATPHRRRLKRSKVISQQDRNDLAEDLEFLEPEVDEETPRQPRDTQTVRKTARMNALDALKRKRSGQPVVAEPDEELEQEEDMLGQPDENYISSDHEDDPVPTSSRSMFQADKEDEDFLVEDDDTTLGIPEDLPLEFSKYASMKPRDLFQYAVEWMVQKKINPAFNIADNLYELAFKKLNDEVSGLVSSKFSSSAWTADFTMSLRARPGIVVHSIDRVGALDFLSDRCDACNRSNHPATFAIQFQGQPYHLATLDNVEQDDEEDTDGSSEQDGGTDDKPGYDAQGRKVPPVSRIYHVGRFCGANAETAHELAHWKFNLYGLVVDWIIANGYNTPEEVVRRDALSAKKRRKAANKISDRMAERGVVKKLWKEFQDTINRARESKQVATRGLLRNLLY